MTPVVCCLDISRIAQLGQMSITILPKLNDKCDRHENHYVVQPYAIGGYLVRPEHKSTRMLFGCLHLLETY